MKAYVIALLCPVATFVAADESAVPKNTVAEESLILTRQTVSYRSSGVSQIDEKKPAENEVVKMEVFKITDWRIQRDFARMMDAEISRRRDEQFSATKGGAIYKSERLDIGFWKHRDLFGDDGKTPLLRIDILRFKF